MNSKVPINLTLGKRLTDTASLPPNATRSFNDPLRASRHWPYILALVIGLAVAVAAGWIWHTWPDVRLPFTLPVVK